MAEDLSPNPPALLIFDLDGTLLDTREDLAAAVNAMRAEFGLRPLSVSTVTRFVGEGIQMLVRRSLRGRPDLWSAGIERCVRYYRRHLADRTRPYPGVRSGLAALRSKGYRLALVSNKPTALCRRLLRHFGLLQHFDVILGGDATPQRKPHPEPVLLAMERTKMPREATWLIGDHWTDIETARRAGVASAWLRGGMGRRGRLRPDRTFGSFSELTRFFLGPTTRRTPASCSSARPARRSKTAPGPCWRRGSRIPRSGAADRPRR